VLLFFPVPPSLRQAAGPLTENLPNVLTGDPCRVDLSLQRPSPRGTKGRLSSSVLRQPQQMAGFCNSRVAFWFHAGSRGV